MAYSDTIITTNTTTNNNNNNNNNNKRKNNNRVAVTLQRFNSALKYGSFVFADEETIELLAIPTFNFSFLFWLSVSLLQRADNK